MHPLYLDHNSTTPLAPEVAEVMLAVWQECGANPASQHRLGQQARRRLEEARENILRLLGGETRGMTSDKLLFTSGGTEANNQVLRGLCGKAPGTLLIGATEHPSVVGPAEFLQTQGYDVQRLRVNRDGTLDLDFAADQINKHDPRPRFVCVMLANNETGVIQPWDELRDLCQRCEVPLVTDAVQAVTKIDVNFRDLGVAAMTVAPHKFHGPIGIGAIVLRAGVKLEPLLYGGHQQEGLRPGTESVALAVSFAKALELAHDDVDRRTRMQALRDDLASRLQSALPEVIINGQNALRLPNTLNLAFLGLDRQELLLALDMAGVCCATGSACASGSSEPSPVLTAMGLLPEQISSSLRFSLGASTTPTDIAEAATRIIKVVNDLRSRKAGRKSPATPPQSSPIAIQ